MYSTCMFCNHDLGRNQVVEHFPVGRRLAFDAAKGRLWVVCRRCERWNLTPIEERWEAIEECEDLFHGIRTRASTDNIGLARHREGTELVRIGEPMRPEFAAWRYGDQFGRRRKKAILVGVGAGAVLATVAIAGVGHGVVSGALLSQSGNFFNVLRAARVVARVPDGGGQVLKLKAPTWTPPGSSPGEGGDGWALEIKKGRLNQTWEGPEAVQMAGRIFPAINRSGARRVHRSGGGAGDRGSGPPRGASSPPIPGAWTGRGKPLAKAHGAPPSEARVGEAHGLHPEASPPHAPGPGDGPSRGAGAPGPPGGARSPGLRLEASRGDRRHRRRPSSA
jgi:hypothetical protein